MLLLGGSRGGCLRARQAFVLSPLTLLEFSFPLSPRPPSPVGKGEIFSLFCRGLRPRHPATAPGAALLQRAPRQLRACAERGTACRADSGTLRRGLPRLSSFAPTSHKSVAPIPPPPPSPAGKGGFLAFLCKGLRPLQPRVCAGRGTGCRATRGAGRGACALPSPALLDFGVLYYK